VIWAGLWSKRRIEAAKLAASHAEREYFDSIAQPESQLNPAHDLQKRSSAAKLKKTVSPSEESLANLAARNTHV